jgi:streptogramin lyase
MPCRTRLARLALGLTCALVAPTAESQTISQGDVFALVFRINESNFFVDQAIVRVDPTTGAQSTIAAGPPLIRPWGLVSDRNGDLVYNDTVVVDNLARPGILRLDPETGQRTIVSLGQELTFTAGQAGHQLAIDWDGSYITYRGRAFPTGRPAALIRIDPVTGLQTIISVISTSTFLPPLSIAIAPNGDYLFTDGPYIVRVNRDTHEQELLLVKCCDLTDIAVQDDGQVVVVSSGTDEVFRFDLTTRTVTDVTQGGLLTSSVSPLDLAIDEGGDYLVAVSETASIVRVDSETGQQTILSTGGALNEPKSIAVIRPPPHPPALTHAGPVRAWLGLQNGPTFDLRAEMYKNGQSIGSAQLEGVRGDPTGKVLQRELLFGAIDPVSFGPDDVFGVALFARIAPGTSPRNGTATLQFNDSRIASGLDVTWGNTTITYSLLDGGVLGRTPGPRKKSIELRLSSTDPNAWGRFGEWTIVPYPHFGFE